MCVMNRVIMIERVMILKINNNENNDERVMTIMRTHM